MTTLYARLEGLPLAIDSYTIEPLSFTNAAGWTRPTTVIRLHGGGKVGAGEDVTWQGADQASFQNDLEPLALAGDWTLESFSRHLDGLQLFVGEPADPGARDLRRWGFESAALDLALRQSDLSLPAALGRTLQPLNFVASLGLGSPASLEPLQLRRGFNADLQFKIDFDESWSPQLVRDLADFGGIRVVDLKGQYRGAFQGPPANAWMYRCVAETLSDAWIEDPEWNECTDAALRPYAERVTWDAILHSVADIEALPLAPRCVNIKPSRFGTVRELMAAYEYCRARDLDMYGGGQFELGPGRGQAQILASLFHSTSANDLAPGVYNDANALSDAVPRSPLTLQLDSVGFRLAADS